VAHSDRTHFGDWPRLLGQSERDWTCSLRVPLVTTDPATSQSTSEVFRFGGAGTVLLIALLLFVGMHPLLLGGVAARLVGGLIVSVILVAGTVAASRSYSLRAIGIGLAIAFGLQAAWLATGNIMIEAALMTGFAVFCLYTAIVILRHVLGFGPLYADRVHGQTEGQHLRDDGALHQRTAELDLVSLAPSYEVVREITRDYSGVQRRMLDPSSSPSAKCSYNRNS
jgi:hypothetical protein